MFKIPRRHASFSNLNIRGENHGKEKVPAVDLTVEFTGDHELVDLLLPVPKDEDNLASEFFFTKDGHLRVPTLNPIKLNRNPEGLLFTIFDKKDPMHFRDGSAKDFELEFQEGGTVKVKCKLQGVPDDGYTERLKKVLFKTIELMIESEQDDLFAQPEPKDDDKDDNQGDLLGKALEDASRGKDGKGRNEGLRNTEVKKDEVSKDQPDTKPVKAKAKAKAKAPAKKK